MLERIKNFALYGDTDREGFHNVKGRIEDANRLTSLLFASVAAILTSAMYVLSFTQEGFSSSQPVFLFGVLCSLVQVAVSMAAKKSALLSYVSVYLGISIFLVYGILIAMFTRPEEQTVTFMVMLIFLPLIFVDRPLRMAVTLSIFIAAFIVMACMIKTEPVLAVDVTDAAIFGILSIISESTVNRAKIRGYVLENKLQIMSETDTLTGLNNRNCYERRLSVYEDLYKSSLSCIYIDVNGLHELNNSKGHKAGDDMLCAVAEAVMNQFGKNDSYRVGGDEFVAFAIDLPAAEIERRLAEIAKRISERGYHIAMGCERVEAKKADINELIVRAESKMYKDKSEYYRANGRNAATRR